MACKPFKKGKGVEKVIKINCTDLIKEAKRDILKYGKNMPCYVYYDDILGYKIATSYNLVFGEIQLSENLIVQGVQTSTLGHALAIFEEQNRPNKLAICLNTLIIKKELSL